MEVNNNRDVQVQFDFKTTDKSDDKVTLKAEINGKNYSFTVIKAGVGKLSDAELKSQYGEKFAKMAKVAEVVDLKAGEILTETKDKLSLKGRKDEATSLIAKTETHTKDGEMRIKLPDSINSLKVNKIREIYQSQVAKAEKAHAENSGSILQDESKHIDDQAVIEVKIAPVQDQAVDKKQAEKTATKINQTKVFFGSTYKKLTAGAAKVVWVPKKDKFLKEGLEGKVIYTPVSDGVLNKLLGLKEREIREEAILQGKIIAKSPEKLSKSEPQFLAVDMKIVFTDDGQFMASASKALGDLDRLIKEESLTLLQAAKLALGPVKGMNELHKLGYVAGDVKAENTLGYAAKSEDGVGDTLVKLADFGKTVEMEADETRFFYTGNMVYAPPERNLSQKGDVFGLGMITLRAMEERIFAKKGTGSLENFPTDKSKLRGVEHFRSTHKSFSKSRVDFFFPTTESNMKNQEVAMKSYIINFEYEFMEHFHDDPMCDNIKLYTALLNDTFSSDPSKRPTALQFELRYEAFINTVENSI